MDKNQVAEQVASDAKEALTKYSGLIQVRRPGHPLFGQEVTVYRVHLVYDATRASDNTREVIKKALDGTKIELHFHGP